MQEARGNTSGAALTLTAHRPNAHGGALNRAPPSGAKMPLTSGNVGRLEARFHGGAVRVRDNIDDALGGFAGTANSAAVNRVRAAHSSKAALAASSRSKDRSDRATGTLPGLVCVGGGSHSYGGRVGVRPACVIEWFWP